jgi:hypothetical protein
LQNPLLDPRDLKTANYSVPNHGSYPLGAEIPAGAQVHDYRFFVNYFTDDISISNLIEQHSPPSLAMNTNPDRHLRSRNRHSRSIGLLGGFAILRSLSFSVNAGPERWHILGRPRKTD